MVVDTLHLKLFIGNTNDSNKLTRHVVLITQRIKLCIIQYSF